MKIQPMRKQKQKPQQVKVDLGQADTIKCKSCGNYLFIQSFVLKKLSPLVSPTGQEEMIPIQVFSCGNCGAVLDGMLDGSGIEEKPKSAFDPSI
jgi:DNA-directed RNA polymerase subunit N (RpoN/RPB10)